jgi:hypothetical protein
MDTNRGDFEKGNALRGRNSSGPAVFIPIEEKVEPRTGVDKDFAAISLLPATLQ